MTYPAKVVLLLPLKAPDQLEQFIERCLKDRVELIAIVGPQARQVEDLIDDIVVGDGSEEGRFIVTSAHSATSLPEAMDTAESWTTSGDNRVELVSF